jgi:hypothetical protein
MKCGLHGRQLKIRKVDRITPCGHIIVNDGGKDVEFDVAGHEIGGTRFYEKSIIPSNTVNRERIHSREIALMLGAIDWSVMSPGQLNKIYSIVEERKSITERLP